MGRIGLICAIAIAIAGPAVAAADPGGGTAKKQVCDRSVATDRSLTRVLNRLPRNRTVCLRGGVHDLGGGVSVRAPQTTIRNYPGERATMLGLLRIEASAQGSVIKNLTLDGSSGSPFVSPLIYADQAVLRNNEITNGHTDTCILINSYYDRPPPVGVLIEGNRIHDCGRLPSTNLDHGIYVAEASGAIIRDNWIYDNADRGIQLYPNANGTTVTGNVIDGNGQGVILGGTGGQAAADNLIAHNVIANSTLRNNVEDYWEGAIGTGNVVRDNCVWTARLDDLSGEPVHSGILAAPQGFTAYDNAVAKPLYHAAGRNNFKLRPRSECAALLRAPPGAPGP
ncbi:MAG TPA: right-handed parallel beta-helix repeat-containing protein [Solirubrobacterales bacterium]|jgi:parallel beta-helix repeat protein